MPGFFGYQSVLSDLEKQRQTGKVTSGTLKSRGENGLFTDVAWASLYVYPLPERTGIGAVGYADIAGRATLYRVGETTAPRVDDKLTAGGRTWQVIGVTPRLNADESDNFAVYDLDLTD